MFEYIQNQIGDITGDYNQIIQIILPDGKQIGEELGILINRLLINEKEEIKSLKKRIEEKEEALKDKRTIVNLQEDEIFNLKTALAEKQKQLIDSEERFAKTFLENNGKNFTDSKELYHKAIQLLAEGRKSEALEVLNRHELFEIKKNGKRKEKNKLYLGCSVLIY